MPRSYEDLPVVEALVASETDDPVQSAQGIPECLDSSPGGAVQAIRFSIRDLLLATAVIACVLGGFTMYGFFGASSIALTCGALLVVFGRKRKKPLLVRLGTALAIPSFCIWGAMMAGWMMFGLGPIYSVQAFPAELKDMAAICNADISAARVEVLGSFIDSQYAWELPLSPAQFKRRRCKANPCARAGQNGPAVLLARIPTRVAAKPQRELSVLRYTELSRYASWPGRRVLLHHVRFAIATDLRLVQI